MCNWGTKSILTDPLHLARLTELVCYKRLEKNDDVSWFQICFHIGLLWKQAIRSAQLQTAGSLLCLVAISSLVSHAAAAAAASLHLCPTLCKPKDGSPPGSFIPGFSRQEYWSGLPFPSPIHESEKWKWSHSVVSNSSRPPGLQPTRLLCPWESPGKNTGVGCHFLLQCMNVKSESEVAQSCWTLRDPLDCSPPGSSVHGIFQARVLEWVAISFSMSLMKTCQMQHSPQLSSTKSENLWTCSTHNLLT